MDSIFMKKFLPFLLVLFLFPAAPVAGEGLLVVQSLPIKPYNQALEGLRSVCTGKTTTLVESTRTEADIAKKVRKINPDLIVAIGMDALTKVAALEERQRITIPVIYLMVPNPQSLVEDNANITGVSMNIEPGAQLSALQQILPQTRKIGIVFDPDKTGRFVRKAHSAATAAGVELLTKTVHNSREAAAALVGMKGKIDLLWLLPDTTVVTPTTIDLLLLSAIEQKIPVFTFSEKSAEKGALLALEIDAHEAGRQAGEMANRILAGKDVRSIGKTDALGGNLTVNLITARKLEITLQNDALKQANVIK